MITLSNNYRFDFAVASGALGFDGRGWWWEKPLSWLGLIDPHEFLVITKTLTLYSRRGNLRWWCPWRCVRPTPGGFINAVGLTNPGLDGWFKRYHRHVVADNLAVAVSIAPETASEADWMARRIAARNYWQLIKAIELNVSCPNTEQPEEVIELTKSMVKAMKPAGLPIIVKLGWTQPYLQICKELDGHVAAFDLINTVPWTYLYPDKPSPLTKYGLEGGLSGERIELFAINALCQVVDAGVKTPIISGGGISDFGNVQGRFHRGAKAVAFGSIFLRHPTLPNKIAREWRTAA